MFSQRAAANIQALNTELLKLEPIMKAFCKRYSYRFGLLQGFRSNRVAWASDVLDRWLELSSDSICLEMLQRGDWFGGTWSLYAGAALPKTTGQLRRGLVKDVFSSLPFLALASLLEERLEEGLSIISGLTPAQIPVDGYLSDTRAFLAYP